MKFAFLLIQIFVAGIVEVEVVVAIIFPSLGRRHVDEDVVSVVSVGGVDDFS